MNNFDYIVKHFPYLFSQHGFDFFSETKYGHFDNWKILLRSTEYWLEFSMDRGSLHVSLCPHLTNSPNQGGRNDLQDWYGISLIISYLTGEFVNINENWTIQGYENQLKEVSRVYKPMVIPIRDLFIQERYKKIKPELEEFAAQWQQILYSRLFS